MNPFHFLFFITILISLYDLNHIFLFTLSAKNKNIMRKTLLIAAIAYSMNAIAQPVILNGDNISKSGTSALLYSGVAAGIGNPGANQTWDFSAVSFTSTGVTWTVVKPDSTPYFSTFPTANYGWTFSKDTSYKYFYFNISATKFDVLADNISAPGAGNDFSPNPKTALKFPFYYGDSVVDTYQKVGGTTINVSTTYDGYGTLITPYGTYTNVWRVKEIQSTGNGTYTWETVNPIRPIIVYTISNNSLTMFGNTPITGINDPKASELSVDLYPNPAKDKLVIKLSDVSSNGTYTLNLFNLEGQCIKEVSIRSGINDVELENLAGGIYFYHLKEGYNTIKTGKIILE